MTSFSETWLCMCALAFLTANSLVRATEDDSRGSMAIGTQRNSGTVKLGRGLQMLRLGKRSVNLDSASSGQQDRLLRSARSIDDQATSHISSSDVHTLLASIFDQPRDETRRQPPLPRYGRDGTNNIDGRLLADALSDGSNVYPADFFPFSNQRLFFRPAPRGGRYRRSLPVGRFAFGDYFVQEGADRSRAMTLPRQFIEDPTHLQPKAVPRPRIGRYQNDQSSIQSI